MIKVVPSVKRRTLQSQITRNVAKGSELHTDQLLSYKRLSKKGYVHLTVNHGEREYVRGDVHINGIESYWSRRKNSINGTHIHVSKKHLNKYSKEFEYRFNSRKNPQAMFPELLSTFPRSE